MGMWWGDVGWDGGKVLWSHTSHHQHQWEHSCLLRLLPLQRRACRALRVLPAHPHKYPRLGTAHRQWGASLGGRWGCLGWWAPIRLPALMWFFAGLARLPRRAGTPGRCLCPPNVSVSPHLSMQSGGPGCGRWVKPWEPSCCLGGCLAPGVLPGAGQACPHLAWVLTRAAGTVWVSSPRRHPIHPPGKTHPCSDPISSSLQGSQGDPGPPGPPVRTHSMTHTGDCHARGMSARAGIPPGSQGGVAVLGPRCPTAPSLSCATSKHCHKIMSPCPLQGSTGPPGAQGPAGTKVWHWHRHRHI